MIEAAKGGHTEIVKLLLEYPKSVTQRTQVLASSNSVQPSSHANLSNGNNQEGEQDSLIVLPSSGFRSCHAKENVFEVFYSIGENKKSIQVSKNIPDIRDNSLSIATNETVQSSLETNHPQLNNKLQILGKNFLFDRFRMLIASLSLSLVEQLQHVEKELHDQAQQQLEINQEYRQQVTDYVHSNCTSGKKKRTTSSSSTSSSSSTTSSCSSNAKYEEISSAISTSNLSLPLPSQTIDFFSTPTIESNPSNNLRLSNKLNLPSLHHSQHHSKIKKSFNRQSATKNERHLEQNLHENQLHLDQMNPHLKNLTSLSPPPTSSSSTTTNECLTSPTKISMHINTDTQKALEHLRELANNPVEMERIQTLANNPNLIQEIRKVANQSFSDQLKTLPPFMPANLAQSVGNENKSNTENLEQTTELTVQTVPSSNPNPPPQPAQSSNTRNLNKVSNIRSLPTVKSHSPPPPSPSHAICCADCPSKSSHILHPTATTTLNHLRFQNRIDVDCETESNHDTALTLSCAGGHEELATLLLQRGANIEHRDKKGFTPLILAGRI